MFKLSESHLEKAKKIALKNRKKKSCNKCYDRGYIGIDQNNLLALCQKCVDIEKATAEWKEYVTQFPELKEYFKEMFEGK
ncbi:MAG: hypothetical protein U9N34_02630 [Candidatus Cloacimonadota bacterium]|nr:hypothetical protein [Candidatus Cloacimonadota bacterium]